MNSNEEIAEELKRLGDQLEGSGKSTWDKIARHMATPPTSALSSDQSKIGLVSRRGELFKLLREAASDWTEVGRRVARLTGEKDGFFRWQDDAEFKTLFTPFVTSCRQRLIKT